MNSGWVAAMSPSSRLCWVNLLCYARAFGKNGSVTLPAMTTLAQVWGVKERDVSDMIDAAQASEAVRVSGSRVSICKWNIYQNGRTATTRAEITWSPDDGWSFDSGSLDRLTRDFPRVDVENELSKMSAWLRANSNRRKRDYARFITNWLSRAPSTKGQKAMPGVEDFLANLDAR